MKYRVFLLLCILIATANSGVHKLQYHGSFTTRTNLEKLFYIESEVMSLSDVFLREEHFAHNGEVPHNLGELKALLAKTKVLHTNISSMDVYLSHPINVLHLAQRLNIPWWLATKAIWSSEPCQKWDVPQLQKRLSNILKNLPKLDDVLGIGFSISTMQITDKIQFDDLYSGVISGHKSMQPVTLKDLSQLAHGAFEGQHYLFTAIVIERIVEMCKKSKEEVCEDRRLYKMAATSYYELSNYEDALKMNSIVLKMDKDNSVAIRNQRFFQNRLKEGRTSGDIKAFPRTDAAYYETCNGKRKRTTRQLSRLKCVMYRTKKMFIFEKVEIHRKKPLILEIHGGFYQSDLEGMLASGQQMYRQTSFGDLYTQPDFAIVPYPTYLYRSFASRFPNLTQPMVDPVNVGNVEIRQVGMNGMYFKRKDIKHMQHFGGHVGSFITFLNDDFDGGEVVFPRYKIKIIPVKGNTIFFFATKAILNICPVSYSTQWFAIQSIFEMRMSDTCRYHEDDLWTRGYYTPERIF